MPSAPFSSRFFSILTAACLHVPVALTAFSLPTLPSLAIPKEEAVFKLNTVLVHVIAKSEDEFFLLQKDDTLIVPAYLSLEMATERLEESKKLDPELTAFIQPYPLSEFLALSESLQASAELQSQKLVFPIISGVETTAKALEILRADGLSDEDIEDNLRVPVFFLDPMVTVSAEGLPAKQYFFFEYPYLEAALSRLPDSADRPKIKVLNLDQVLQIIIDEDQDVFAFYPTAQYLRNNPDSPFN